MPFIKAGFPAHPGISSAAVFADGLAVLVRKGEPGRRHPSGGSPFWIEQP
jgi:hypothetical protein